LTDETQMFLINARLPSNQLLAQIFSSALTLYFTPREVGQGRRRYNMMRRRLA